MVRMYAKEKKWNLLLSAISLFSENHFQTVTIQMVCQKSGITHGAFYSYFESKEELLEEIYRLYAHMFKLADKNWKQLMQTADTEHPHTVIKKALMYHFSKEDEQLYFKLSKVINSQMANDPRAQAVFGKCIIDMPRKARPIIEKMVADGRIEPVDLDSFFLLYCSAAYYASVQPHPKRYATFTHSSWKRMLDYLLSTIKVKE